MIHPGGTAPLKSPNLRIRLLAAFVYRFLDNMTIPFMTIYLTTKFGIAVGGFMVVTVAVACVIAAVAGGPICDRLGRRPVLVFGEFGTAAGFFGAAVGTWSVVNVPLLAYGCFFVAAALSSFVLPAHDATIADITEPASRQSYYALNYWSINFGIGAGAILGGLFYSSYFPVILAVAGLMLSAVGTVTALLLTETLPSSLRAQAVRHGPGLPGMLRQSLSAYRIVLVDMRYMALIGAATLAISIEFQLTNYIAVRLARQFSQQPLIPGLGNITGPGIVGVLRLENTLLVVTLTLVLAKLFRKLPDRFRLIAGLCLFTTGSVVLAVANIVWILIVAIVVLTIGELLNVPVKQARLVNSAREDGRGTYLAVYELTGNLGWVIASLCIPLGALLRPAGMAALYGVSGATAAAVFGRSAKKAGLAPSRSRRAVSDSQLTP